MAKKKISEIVEEILADFLNENGYELYHIEFVKEGKDRFLRVYIDLDNSRATDGEGKPQYIGTADCEKVSRYLSTRLDEEDPIEQNYYLEVSSPGMDRQLVKPRHYSRYVGSRVEVKLYKSIDGTKNIEGILSAFDGESVKVKADNGMEWNLQLTEIAKARLAVIF